MQAVEWVSCGLSGKWPAWQIWKNFNAKMNREEKCEGESRSRVPQFQAESSDVSGNVPPMVSRPN